MKTFAEMSLEELQQADRECRELYDECMHNARQYGPIYAISDLHMGDGGARDNFPLDDRERQLNLFLDYVAGQPAGAVPRAFPNRKASSEKRPGPNRRNTTAQAR